MAIRKYLSTNEDYQVHSETILNVLRRSDDLVMGTSDIADSVGMSDTGVRDRLKELEEEDRVISQEIGSEKGHTAVWGLSPDERQEPIIEEIDRLVKWTDSVWVIGRSIFLTALAFLGIGAVLWFSTMTMGLLTGDSSTLIDQIHAVGYSIAGGGWVALAASGAIKLVTMGSVAVAERMV